MNLIFLPGALGNTEFWQPVMERLPSNYRKTVIAYPGFADHAAQVNIQSFQDVQDYVLDQIQQPSVVIAQSMGGIFAVQAALQKPELIKGLVLIATSGGIDLSPFHVTDWRADYARDFDVPDWFAQYQTNLDDQLYKIDCPVLLIWGNADPISPVEVGEYLKDILSQSELHVIEQGQHDLAFSCADQVLNLIEHFIKTKF